MIFRSSRPDLQDRAHAEDNGQDVGIHVGGGSKGGGRFLDDGGILQAAPEHGHTVYFYSITVKPV